MDILLKKTSNELYRKYIVKKLDSQCLKNGWESEMVGEHGSGRSELVGEVK